MSLLWKRKAILISLLPLLPVVAFASDEAQTLPNVQVEGDAEELNAQVKSQKTQRLTQETSGNTLGDFLQQQPNVESASYGPAVGRPVVRGMSGYRVKILQNDIEINDLSAMSQDHAVGVMPKASERIELLKGPASIIYGASAGGTVRLLEGTSFQFPEKGLNGHVESEAGNNNDLRAFGAALSATSDRFTFGLSGNRIQTDNYTDGNGQLIKDSDVLTEQGKVFAGWRYQPKAQILLSYEKLNKDYGIPNSTPESTRINMQRDSYGFHWSENELSNFLDKLSFDVNYSDYLHDETEGSRKDGLFGQKSLQAILAAEYFWQDWLGKVQLSVQNNQLKVCHEHGACEEFTEATRSGVESNLGASLEGYINSRNLPYSHGHPMPDTEFQTWTLGGNAEKPMSSWGKDVYLSLGVNLQLRRLEADPSNIQETWVVPKRVDADYYESDLDFAGSLSIGLRQPLAENLQSELNISYLERLPSVDELYWNGFHHATDSYIFGNRSLNKERSINVDWDLVLNTLSADWSLSAYSYFFKDYIYQNPLFDANGNPEIDPFHLSDVWQTFQTDAMFAGVSLRNDWRVAEWRAQPLVWSNQIEFNLAQDSLGDALPRSAPYQYLSEFAYTTNQWSAKLSLKHVFAASQLAENETKTDAYSLVSLYADWKPKVAYGDLSIWIKGDNLLDEYAQNHLSFLKESAPLIGRNLKAGIRWNF